jgi:hypothetical protein
MSCVYENCNKLGIFMNSTLCRIHKNYKNQTQYIVINAMIQQQI